MKVNWVEGSGFDSNIFLIRDDLSLLIDAGTGLNFDQVKKEIEGAGIKLEELDILVNTHCHYDHVGGDPDFLEISDCKLMTSEPTAKILGSGDEGTTLAKNFGGELKPLEVSKTLQENDQIKLGETTLQVLFTPGHTEGGISLYEPHEKVLFSGDTVFSMGIGRMDLPTSDSKEMKNSLQKLAKLDVNKLYPGHGPIEEGNAEEAIQRGLNFLV